MLRPASSTSVFRPFSVSSFAAHPPVIPEPITIASYVLLLAAMRVSLCLLLCRHRHAAMLSAGNNFQFELARKTNFRRVVSVQRDALEHYEKISSQLRVALRHRIPVARRTPRTHAHGLIHRAHQRQLLQRRSIDEILPIKLIALLVDTCQPVQKMIAVLVCSP